MDYALASVRLCWGTNLKLGNGEPHVHLHRIHGLLSRARAIAIFVFDDADCKPHVGNTPACTLFSRSARDRDRLLDCRHQSNRIPPQPPSPKHVHIPARWSKDGPLSQRGVCVCRQAASGRYTRPNGLRFCPRATRLRPCHHTATRGRECLTVHARMFPNLPLRFQFPRNALK